MIYTNRDKAYFRAKHRVDRLRKFYNHVVIYLLVNIGILTYKIIRNLMNGETFNEALFDFSTFTLWTLWGIGLGLHAFSVFGSNFILGKNWEEEKIKQYMKEDTSKEITNK